MSEDNYIKKEDLVKGVVYKCRARNFDIGKWNGETFDYLRSKFGSQYMDREFHWDDGPPYGTVKPWRVLEEAKPPMPISWDYTDPTYNFMAMDGDGIIFLYSSKPVWHENLGGSASYWEITEGHSLHVISPFKTPLKFKSELCLWERH